MYKDCDSSAKAFVYLGTMAITEALIIDKITAINTFGYICHSIYLLR